MATKLIIDKKEYFIKFAYSTLHLLGVEWGMKKVSDVENKIASLFPKKGQKKAVEYDFDHMAIIGDMLVAGIKSGTGDPKIDFADIEITRYEVLDFASSNQEVFSQVIQEYVKFKSPPEKPKPAGK